MTPRNRARWRGLLGLVAGLVVLALWWDLSVLAQPFWGRFRYPPRFPDEHPHGRFAFARLMYDSVRREPGGSGWTTDYPGADINFMIRFSELTTARVSMEGDGEGDPRHVVVRPTDDRLFDYPFLFATDVGTIGLTDAEVLRLREYFLKGGFLWVDDFWGPRAWDHWESQIRRVLPPAEYPIFDIPADHPLRRTMFTVNEIPQIPNIGFWRRSGGETSERGALSAEVNFRGIADARGRLMVLMSHNTDIADGWEREGEDPQFFYLFSPDAYAIGINTVIYSMTH